jgi:hypothetical protein
VGELVEKVCPACRFDHAVQVGGLKRPSHTKSGSRRLRQRLRSACPNLTGCDDIIGE